MRWLEGLLFGSGLLLVYQPTLWQIIDEWVAQLGEGDFKNVLPLLRRAFAKFSAPERQRLLQLVRNGPARALPAHVAPPLIPENAEKVLPTLRLLLGLPEPQ